MFEGLIIATLKSRCYFLACNSCSDWKISAGKSLCDGGYIWFYTPVFCSEHFTSTTKSVNYFITYHYYAVFVTYFPYGGPVFRMGYMYACRR